MEINYFKKPFCGILYDNREIFVNIVTMHVDTAMYTIEQSSINSIAFKILLCISMQLFTTGIARPEACCSVSYICLSHALSFIGIRTMPYYKTQCTYHMFPKSYLSR